MNDRLDSAPYLTNLLHCGHIYVSGADSAKFLHSQLSAELLDLDENQWRAAAYCTPQGRVAALVMVARNGNVYTLELAAEMAESTADRLRRFVLRSEVQLEVAQNVPVFGCWGENLAAVFDSAGLPLPEAPQGRARHDGLDIWALPGPAPRCLIQGPSEILAKVRERLALQCRPADLPMWRLQKIASAWPEIYPATRDQFLPQSLNLESLGALSFKKGCFPGQEIIARVHYRGRLKQQLYRASVQAPPPAAGSEVLNSAGDKVGTVLYAAQADSGTSQLLAVLRELHNKPHYLPGGEKLLNTERV